MATYFVAQATGQQSQWTIKHLLAAGAKVHALVRDLQKVPPNLQSPEVTLFKGDSTDFDSIFQAAQGCKGAFLNTFPIPGLELQQGKTLVDACKKAGIESIVLATTFCTGNKAMWDDTATEECGLRQYYASKSAVEDVVREAGFKAYTILRPAFIHIDYMKPHVYGNFPRLATHGELDHAYENGARMPQTDASDVGKYASAALLNPAKFNGQEIELAGENLTIEEVRDILAKVSGREVKTRKRTPEEVEQTKTVLFAQAFHVWANVKDFGPSIAAARDAQAKFGIPLASLESALEREKDRLLECLPA
ncbi:Nitrogen metabolite repression protein nmrA [Paramyrothecium foliicola]|nr:Nitrogen metabolite repression protein nmrA [Paramyrothecium foliicola]